MTPKYSPNLWRPPPPQYPQNLHAPKIFIFLKAPRNIEIQNFEPPKNDSSLRMYENIRVPPGVRTVLCEIRWWLKNLIRTPLRKFYRSAYDANVVEYFGFTVVGIYGIKETKYMASSFDNGTYRIVLNKTQCHTLLHQSCVNFRKINFSTVLATLKHVCTIIGG